MTYVAALNGLIRNRLDRAERFVAFGQNMAAGSSLAGLTRGLTPRDGFRVINTPNCENAQIGFGFGMMLRGVDSAFFVKQLDFLLLTCDQIVNTYNMLRQRPAAASFTVVAIVVDSGFEGPQSRLNNFADLCSLAHVPGYAIASRQAADSVIAQHLVAPGFRIIGVSQRLFGAEMPDEEGAAAVFQDGAIIRHAEGEDATVVAFNFAFPQAQALRREMAGRGIGASLFSVPGMLVDDWSPVLSDLRRTGRLVLIDDSRSFNRPAHRLHVAAMESGAARTVLPLYRPIDEADIRPNADRFEVDHDAVIDGLLAA